MKKNLFFAAIFVLLVLSGNLQAQRYFKSSKFEGDYKHLVLTHPTVYNLETFVNLINKELIRLPKTRLVGVFYSNEEYDYSNSLNYLDTCSYLPIDIYMHKIDGAIEPENLYENNALTDDFKEIFKDSEGVIFFGGPDMPPVSYGEKTNLLTSIYDPYRHYFELSFLFHLTGGKQNGEYINFMESRKNYLIYGFCLGMQSMNVASGGSLVQDIPTELYNLKFAEEIIEKESDQIHRNYYRHISIDEKLLSGSFHRIQTEKRSFLRDLLNEEKSPLVYSNHHQCIGEVGQNYLVQAKSMDGKIIESIRHKKYSNVIGVQFHPEAMRIYNEEIEFRREPGYALENGKAILIEAGSYQFHKAYWKDFENRFNRIKN